MIKKFIYPDLERERFYECLKCNEIILSPLCHNCLAQQLEVWLSNYPDLKKRLLPELHKYLKTINNSILDATRCVVCGSRKAALCPYCFTEFVLRMLKKLQVHKQVVKEFLIFFGPEINSGQASQLSIS